jgi:hypothetical protein
MNRSRSFNGVAGYGTENRNSIPNQDRNFSFGQDVRTYSLFLRYSWYPRLGSPIMKLTDYSLRSARIWMHAWSFGCGVGDHGTIPNCSMFRLILGPLILTIQWILGGAHQSRVARLNICLCSMSRIGMRAHLHHFSLYAVGTGKFSKCERKCL